jgi:hypothetical protein
MGAASFFEKIYFFLNGQNDRRKFLRILRKKDFGEKDIADSAIGF